MSKKSPVLLHFVFINCNVLSTLMQRYALESFHFGYEKETDDHSFYKAMCPFSVRGSARLTDKD